MDVPISQHYPSQKIHDGNIFHPQSHPHAPTLASQLDLDTTDPFQFNTHLETHPSLHAPQPRNAFDQRPLPRLHGIRSLIDPNSHDHNAYLRGGQYGVLTPDHQLPSQPQPQPETIGRPQIGMETRLAPLRYPGGKDGHFSNLKIIPNPPDLEQWRKKLFDVDEHITLTEDQYDRLTCL